MSKNGYVGIIFAVREDTRFNTWKRFVASMDGRIPFGGFRSEVDARGALDEEILRLKSRLAGGASL